MTEIDDLQRRITAALERIGYSLDRLPAPSDPIPPVADQTELKALREALDDEKAVNAQLAERLRAMKDKASHATPDADRRIEALTRHLDVQGMETQRLRKTTVQLRDQLRVLREAAEKGVTDPGLVNKAMLAELEAMRSVRAADAAEMDEILAELAPHLLPAPPSEEHADA